MTTGPYITRVDRPMTSRLQHFELTERIATGGMAEIYRAVLHTPNGRRRDVCVKKLRPELVDDEQFVEMFISEAKLTTTLLHENIARVYDLCVSDAREYFLVMEFVDGVDLSRLLRLTRSAGTTLPAPLVLTVATQVCRALAYAHAKRDADGRPLNIVHRDISPQNILISKAGEVKLTDFGIAKSNFSMTQTAAGIVKGKYGYMSPEQAAGESLDGRTDIYNLGIVLYEAFSGERCYAGTSDHSTLNLMKEAAFTPLRKVRPDVPRLVEAIVTRALMRDPSHRYTSAEEMGDALTSAAKTLGMQTSSAALSAFVVPLLEQSRALRPPPRTAVVALSSLIELPSAELRAASDSGASAIHELSISDDKPSFLRRVSPRVWIALALGIVALTAGASIGWTLRRAVWMEKGLPAYTPHADRARQAVATSSICRVVILSDPPGAKIQLDGSGVAEPTPATIMQPRDAAEHGVAYALGGHASKMISYRHAPGSTTVVFAELETKAVPVGLSPSVARASEASASSLARIAVWTSRTRQVIVDGQRLPVVSDGTSFFVTPNVDHDVELQDGDGRRVCRFVVHPGITERGHTYVVDDLCPGT